MDRTKDLRKRGERAVLVKRPGVDIGDESSNYVKVEAMDPVIEEYCDIYSSDLSERLQLDDDTLPDALVLPALLNPLFGNERRIEKSGLMTGSQRRRGTARLLQKMQDVLDKINPPAMDSDDDSESEDDERSVEVRINENYRKAEQEWKQFEDFKAKKYRPGVLQAQAHGLVCLENDAFSIYVGPVDPEKLGRTFHLVGISQNTAMTKAGFRCFHFIVITRKYFQLCTLWHKLRLPGALLRLDVNASLEWLDILLLLGGHI